MIPLLPAVRYHGAQLRYIIAKLIRHSIVIGHAGHFHVNVNIVVVNAHRCRLVHLDLRLRAKLQMTNRKVLVMSANQRQSIAFLREKLLREQFLEVHLTALVTWRIDIRYVLRYYLLAHIGCLYATPQIIKIRRIQYLVKHPITPTRNR